MRKFLLFLFILLNTTGIGFAQSIFYRDYYEKISTYHNQYSRETMFKILNVWLDEASAWPIDRVQYEWNIYSQKDKQNYAWTIERGTKGYQNYRGLYHYITFYLSNGYFTLYYPERNAPLTGYSRFQKRHGDENEMNPFRYIFDSFIRESKNMLDIYNDNYGTESLKQLDNWAGTVCAALWLLEFSIKTQAGYSIF